MICAAICFNLLTLAADAPRAPVPVVNPGVDRLNTAVCFYANFENGAAAEMASGDARAVPGKELPAFAPGRFGRALVAGGAGGRIEYRTKGNLDMTRPGALSLWVAPVDWIQKGKVNSRPYIHFFARRGTLSGSFIVERMGFSIKPKRADALWVGFAVFPVIGNVGMCAERTLDWKKGEWHLVAVNWDRRGFEVSVDGRPFKRKAFPQPLDQKYLRLKNEEEIFRFGHAGGETTLLDELLIYTRPIANEEVRDLYAAEPLRGGVAAIQERELGKK